MRPKHSQLVARATYLHTNRKTMTLDPSNSNQSTVATTTDHEMEKVVWFWHLTDMFNFENIGFSKTINSDMKYLTCADCEREILGFQVLSEGNNFFLAANRVVYQ